MPTPSAQKALTFVAIIVLLGGAVRVVRAGSSPDPSAMEQQALARQATAVESASASAKARPPRGRSLRGRRPSGDSSGGTSTGARAAGAASAAAEGIGGFPPPGPRIDVGYRTNQQRSSSEVMPGAGAPTGMRDLVDLDRASER